MTARGPIFVTALGIVLLACREDPVAAMESWASDACHCTDRACARQAGVEALKLRRKFSWVLDQELQRRARVPYDRGAQCVARLGVHLS